MCLLREIFGAGVERVKLEHRPFKTPSGKVRPIYGGRIPVVWLVLRKLIQPLEFLFLPAYPFAPCRWWR